MKKFTKVLASFCAMTMIFSVFSFTVFADELENPADQPATEAVTEEEKQDEEPEAAPAEAEAPAEASEEETAEVPAEEPVEQPAEEPAKEPAEQPVVEQQVEVADVPGQEAVNEGEGSPEQPAALFANGVITQADITANGGKLPETAGNYTLAENVTVTAGANVETNDASITIDLNGHTITYTGTESMYVLGRIRGTAGDNAELNTTPINWEDCATGVVLTIQGTGTITGEGTTGHGSSDYWINATGVGVDGKNNRGGCVLIEYGCKFILNGGTITGFEAKDEGGAVCASNGSEFIMNGGTISNCSSKNGGAISGQASSKTAGPGGENICSLITINGGTIEDNEATQVGGGIYINRGKILLYGGHISGNNANSSGGGIAFVQGPHGNIFELKGSPQVCGNTFKGQTNVNKANIYLGSNVVMKLTGDLYTAATLYVGTQSNANEVDIIKTNNQSFDINSIHSDIPSKQAYFNGSSLITLKPDTDPKVAGYVIGIGGEIYFKTYIDFGSAAQSDVDVSYFYVYNKNGTETTISKDVTSYASDGNGDYFIIPVESACMTADITITLTYDNRNTDYETTVEDVANASVAIDSSYADLVKALLTYGGYAQKQLKINTNKLPVVSGVDFDAAPDYGLSTATYTPASDPDLAFKGANASFLSKTEVKFRFLKSALGDTAPAMTVTYAGGTKTVQGEVSGNYVIYTIKGADEAGFVASRYNESFSFAVGSVSGEYSIYTYLQVINGTGSQPMKNLAQAYYNFAIEAAKIA